MKTKKRTHRSNRPPRRDDLLPHELGTHLFAMIKRNLRAASKTPAPPAAQLTFAF